MSEQRRGATARIGVLCAQEYDGTEMRAVPCTRCRIGWDGQRCQAWMGVEHLPLVAHHPVCPIQDRCQHQVQSPGPCPVRARGLICESALIAGGLSPAAAASHPLSFHAMLMADA